MTKAQKSDWQNCKDMPEDNVVLSFEQEYSLEDYKRIQDGVVPRQMEDKWFIYFEDDKLYCHRSWTGICIYIVEFAVDEDVAKIKTITVNRDNEQYEKFDNDWDCRFAAYLISLLLLDNTVPYPKKEELDKDIAVVQQWSEVGRAIFKRKK
jgi:hypothetical protein